MSIKNINPGQRVTKEKLERARQLRREKTPAEKILWEELRGNKLGVHLAPSILRAPPPNSMNLEFGGGWVGAE